MTVIKACDRDNAARAEREQPTPTLIFRGSGLTIKPVDDANQRAHAHRLTEEAQYWAHAPKARWCEDCRRWVWP